MARIRLLGKCAIIFFLSPLHRLHGCSDLTEHHLGNVAGSCAKNGYRFRRVEVTDAVKVLLLKESVGIIAAAHKKHIRHATFQHLPEPYGGIQLVQFFQQAAFLGGGKFGEVVTEIVLHDKCGSIQQSALKDAAFTDLTEPVAEHIRDLGFIPRLHLPEVHSPAVVAVGIRYVKNVPELIRFALVHKKRNALCAFVYPASKLIPDVNFSAGSGCRLLGVDEKLISEAVLVVVGGGSEKRHVALSIGGDAAGLVRRHLADNLVFTRHGYLPPCCILIEISTVIALLSRIDAYRSPVLALETFVTSSLSLPMVLLISS